MSTSWGEVAAHRGGASPPSPKAPLLLALRPCFTQAMAEKKLRFEPDSLDILKRGTYVQVTTRGAATRWAIARAAFLDSLLRDHDVVGQVVEEFNKITDAPAIIDAVGSTMAESHGLAVRDGLLTGDGRVGPRLEADLSPSELEAGKALGNRMRFECDRLFRIVTGKDREQSRALVLAAARWTWDKKLYWPWLVSDLVNWYRDKVLYQSPHGGWYGTLQRKPADWKFSVANDTDLLPKLVLRRSKKETPHEYRERARKACAEFLRELEDVWPAGRIPSNTEVIERKIRWFYENRVRGVSISAIANDFAERYKDLPPDDRLPMIDGRRKDVREGIRDAEAWLSSSGPIFIGPPMRAQRIET